MIDKILDDIREERERQEAKWGIQRHDFTVWMTVLGEEFGEACEALLMLRSAEDTHLTAPQVGEYWDRLRREVIQVAAVAVAIVEHIDEVTANLPDGSGGEEVRELEVLDD